MENNVEHKPIALVVDDEVAFTDSLRLTLQHDGYEVHVVHEGNEAVEKVGKLNPDIVLLDVMMPKLDGFHVCRVMKYNKKTSYIPVIMITARSRQSDRDLGHEVGADAYLVKPFEIEELLGQMKILLKRSYIRKQEMLLNAEREEKTSKRKII